MKNQYEIDYQQGYDTANEEWLGKVKQAKEEIENLTPWDEGTVEMYEVLAILDKLIAESEG